MKELQIRVKDFSETESKLYERWKERWKDYRPEIVLGVFYGSNINVYGFDNVPNIEEMYRDLGPIVGYDNIRIVDKDGTDSVEYYTLSRALRTIQELANEESDISEEIQ